MKAIFGNIILLVFVFQLAGQDYSAYGRQHKAHHQISATVHRTVHATHHFFLLHRIAKKIITTTVTTSFGLLLLLAATFFSLYAGSIVLQRGLIPLARSMDI